MSEQRHEHLLEALGQLKSVVEEQPAGPSAAQYQGNLWSDDNE